MSKYTVNVEYTIDVPDDEFDMPDYDRYPYKRCPECGAVVQNAD